MMCACIHVPCFSTVSNQNHSPVYHRPHGADRDSSFTCRVETTLVIKQEELNVSLTTAMKLWQVIRCSSDNSVVTYIGYPISSLQENQGRHTQQGQTELCEESAASERRGGCPTSPN